MTDRTTTMRTPDLVEAALLEVATVPGGIHRSVLWAAVAARLAEMDPSAPPPEPDRVLRAMSLPTIDHRGPEFGALGLKVLADMQKIFKTQQPSHLCGDHYQQCRQSQLHH